MRSAGFQKIQRVVGVYAAPNLQSAGVGSQGFPGSLLVTGPQLNHVSAFESVFSIQLGIPCAGTFRYEIGFQTATVIGQGAADDLFDLSVV
jgi:hypothetical protein